MNLFDAWLLVGGQLVEAAVNHTVHVGLEAGPRKLQLLGQRLPGNRAHAVLEQNTPFVNGVSVVA